MTPYDTPCLYIAQFCVVLTDASSVGVVLAEGSTSETRDAYTQKP